MALETRYRLTDVDPFMCTCGPCKKFWKENFNNAADLLRQSSLSRANDTATISSKNQGVKVGDRVTVHGKYPGTVKFVGVTDDDAIAPQLYVGVKLDDNVNSIHNGIFKGKRYFHCPPGHGAMVKYTEVQPLKSSPKNPPTMNNYMFPSWEEVKKRRKERNEKLASIYEKAGVSPPPTVMPPLGSAHRYRTEPIINVNDPNDIAIKDQTRKRELEQRRQQVRAEDKEKEKMKRLTQQFGSGPEAMRMAQTLMKLQQAYQDGLALTNRRSTLRDNDSADDDY